MVRVLRFIPMAVVILPLLSVAAAAAMVEYEPVAQDVAQYHVQLDEDDQLKISVHVWGKVSAPGLYIVPRTTDLISLISYAGGPAPDADLSNVRIVRRRAEASEVIKVDVARFMASGNKDLIPLLEPGDTVEIGPNRIHGLSRFVQFIAQTAVIVSTYYLIFER
jgi:hypothetical protein